MSTEPHLLRVVHRSRPIAVWVAGDGPPVVILHGWGLSGRPYRDVLRAMAGHGYRAIAPSLSVMDPPWSLQGLAEVTTTILSSMDTVPAAFVGHSFGGAVAVQLAADFPEMASALLLVNALGVSPGRGALVRTVVPGRHWRIGVRRATAAALLASASSKDGWASLSGATRWVLSSTLEPEMERIRETEIPSAVLWAEADALLPMRIGERAAELLDAQFEAVIADDGWPGKRAPDHDWPLVGPEFFASKIAHMLDVLAGS
jgi:pimeloyl-ACP methyl ester carboxylesterase